MPYLYRNQEPFKKFIQVLPLFIFNLLQRFANAQLSSHMGVSRCPASKLLFLGES
jgi:hypothetical protein